jgi:single-strand DNA-binding protein
VIPVSFTGNLAFDPEISFTPNGNAVTKFTVVTKERRFDKASGGWTDGEASFWDVETWRDQAQEAYEKLRKGDTVFVAGKMFKEQYESKDGQKRSAVKITADHVGQSMRWGKPREEPEPKPATFSAPDDDNTPPPF